MAELGKRNVLVGDIVLIVNSNQRGSWSLGKVVNTKLDKSGLVRDVTLKTASSELRRPIHKLCLLLEADTKL